MKGLETLGSIFFLPGVVLSGLGGLVIFTGGSWGGLQYVVLVLGIVLLIVGAVCLVVAEDTAKASANDRQPAGDSKKCPDCAEIIKSEARKCRFCGKDFLLSQMDAPSNAVAGHSNVELKNSQAASVVAPSSLVPQETFLSATDSLPHLYLWLHEKQSGPYTPEQIRAMLAHGDIIEDTPLWTEGMPEWIPLSGVRL